MTGTRGATDPYAVIRRLYHFTDARNVASIRETGAILSLERMADLGIRAAAPGGDEASQLSDWATGMHTYVHLCIHSAHPMVYSATQAGRIGRVVYLEIDRQVLYQEGTLFVPGMANTRGIRTYSMAEAVAGGLLADAEALYRWIDWRVYPEAKASRIRAEKFEILVPDAIPIEFIRNMPNG